MTESKTIHVWLLRVPPGGPMGYLRMRLDWEWTSPIDGESRNLLGNSPVQARKIIEGFCPGFTVKMHLEVRH